MNIQAVSRQKRVASIAAAEKERENLTKTGYLIISNQRDAGKKSQCTPKFTYVYKIIIRAWKCNLPFFLTLMKDRPTD